MVNVTSPCSYYRKHIPSDNTENSSRSMEIRHLSETGTGWLRAPCCRGMSSTMCEEAAAGSPAAHTDPYGSIVHKEAQQDLTALNTVL